MESPAPAAAAPLPAGAGPPRSTRASSAAKAAEPRARGRVGGALVQRHPPSSNTRMRSASATASPTSCVTSTDVKPSRRHSVSISCCMSMRVSASSAPSGSSSSSRPGRCTSARASDPLTLPARQLRRPVAAPVAQTDLAQHRRGLRRSRRGRPSATLSSTDFHGSSRASWNMMRTRSSAPHCGNPSNNTGARAGGPPCSPLGASSPPAGAACSCRSRCARPPPRTRRRPAPGPGRAAPRSP